jgi:hypothetical protein
MSAPAPQPKSTPAVVHIYYNRATKIGICTLANGDRITGEFNRDPDVKSAGVFNGRCTKYFANGETIMCKCADNMITGQVTFMHENGNAYVGFGSNISILLATFVNSLGDGDCAALYSNGVTVGKVRDHNNGDAIDIISTRNEVIRVTMQNDVRQGPFTSYCLNNGAKYSGQHVDDRIHGEVVHTAFDNTKIIMQYKDGKKCRDDVIMLTTATATAVTLTAVMPEDPPPPYE